MADATVALSRRIEPEDQARADFYALLARLFAAAPDAALLAAIAGAAPLAVATRIDEAGDAAVGLARAWDRLRAASAAMDAAAASQEYIDLFVGVGTPPVNLHASHWIAGAMMQKPLADVRATLAGLGLARKAESAMVEDHLAALCETMRMLVAGDGKRSSGSIAQQRGFFERHLAGWTNDCCAAIEQNSVANYYRPVAEFTEYFLALERDSFAIE
ncbi:MAG: molecular chaperone TorD family protein [Betaproteobacteria bacterium]